MEKYLSSKSLSLNSVYLTELDYKVLNDLQNGIQIISRPYEKIAKKFNISEQDIVNIIKKSLLLGAIRKIGASLNHFMLGYSYNVMLVLNVPDEKVQYISKFICSFEEISHCYLRERVSNSYFQWPYNLYSVIHGKNKDACDIIINKIIRYGSIEDYLSINSIKELKKTGVRL